MTKRSTTLSPHFTPCGPADCSNHPRPRIYKGRARIPSSSDSYAAGGRCNKFSNSAQSTGLSSRSAPRDQLLIKQAIRSKHDPHCCPSQTRTLYYGWHVDEQHLRRLRVDGPNPIEEPR
jgi:hypothetical protein